MSFFDGLSEGRIEDGQCLGLRAIAQLVVALDNKLPAEMLKSISGRITECGKPLRDDLTVLIVRSHMDVQEASG